MTDLLDHYGAFAAIAFFVGALVAFGSRARPAQSSGLLRRSDHTIALGLFLAIAVAQVTLGRVSLYFDGALLLLFACLAGFGATAALFGPIARDRLAWRIGAGALAITCAAANLEAARSLETELRHKLGSLLARDGGDPLNFELSGRDLFLPSDTPGLAAAAARLAQAGGVRMVWSIDALSPPAAALRERALAEDAARVAEGKAALAEWERKRQAAIAAAAPPVPAAPAPLERRSAASKGDSRRATIAPTPPTPAPPAPLVWSPPRDPTLPVVAAKEPEPPPAEPPACLAALAEAARSIRFEAASAALGADAQKRLTLLAESLKQCPQAILEIRGGGGDASAAMTKTRRLSLRRMRAVADYLARAGVAQDRLAEIATTRAGSRVVEIGVR